MLFITSERTCLNTTVNQVVFAWFSELFAYTVEFLSQYSRKWTTVII